ncbi:MAG: dihydrofolate reductase family protein [Streptosporangiaceae bacterium]
MRLTVTTFLSLDGVYQSPGAPDEDGTGYEYGGWTAPYGDENSGKFITSNFANADAFLLGRKTYEIFAAYWPRVTDPDHPIAAPLNSLPKYVVTSTLASLDWNNSTPVTGDLADEVGKLKARPGNELQVHGSGQLVQALITHGLVDELRLMIFPVILGTGKQLFPREPVAAAMRVADSQTTGTGVMLLTLRPDGPARFGSLATEAEA